MPEHCAKRRGAAILNEQKIVAERAAAQGKAADMRPAVLRYRHLGIATWVSPPG
jgi:hypothetical protein